METLGTYVILSQNHFSVQEFYHDLRQVWQTGCYADVLVVCSDGCVPANLCLLSAGETDRLLCRFVIGLL